MSIPNPYPNIADKEINDVKTWSSAKIINELQPALNTEKTLEETYEGNIVTFNNLTNKEITSLECQILPIQEGTGTPSPSNPRPISGTSALNVITAGANVWDEEVEEGFIYISGNALYYGSNASTFRSKNFISCVGGQNYYVVCAGYSSWRLFGVDANKENPSQLAAGLASKVVSIPSGISFLKFYVEKGGKEYDNDISINYPSTDTAYHAHNITTTTPVPLNRTIYGGSAEVVGGSGESEWGYIASYNGETITEPWLSSIDAYVEGTLPSTGAEVVYKLTTPTSFTFEGVTVECLEGINNIWTDTDDIKVTTGETDTIGNILKERGILP